VVEGHLDARLNRIELRLDELLTANRARRSMVGDISGDLQPILRSAFESVVTKAGQLDQQGYADFGREVLGVVDRIVTSFSPQDVRALGDNIVLILEALREMTQPEVMTMVRRTAHIVGEQPTTRSSPPSVIGLVRELREPQVRQGLDQLINILRSMGDQPEGADNNQANKAAK
jgi:uncharacterized protein YjgD (DUF1641 family)